jgi:ferric hydroxamate transport system ATP-binding protein
MSGDEAAALRGVDLDLAYHGDVVVHGASVGLRPGEVTALVGPNGSGKSTLLRALARLHAPARGGVRLDETTDALALSRRAFARRVTLLAQSRPTPTGISVQDVVGFGRHPYRGRWRAADPEGASVVAEALRLTGVEHLAERSVDELSGGQLQRVWVAGCLAQQTAVLLLDEPTTHLDLRYQVELLDLVRDLADQQHVAVGLVLHDLDQAASVADVLVLLDRGRVRAAGPPAEVLTGDRLSETYGIRVEVDPDPVTGALRTRAVGRHALRPVGAAGS